MKKRALMTLTCLVCSSALGAGLSPVPGSSRPDAFGRAGQSLNLLVPEVAGRTVNINGIPATIASQNVTINIPARTPPGRTLVRFANVSDGTVLATREIDVLPPSGATGGVQDRRVQLVLNPSLRPEQVQTILNSLTSLGTLVSKETLPKPKTPGASPCGGTLAEIELKPGIALEAALNLLLQGSSDLWYPDPLSTYKTPAYQSTQSQTNTRPSFHYPSSPVIPRNVLGIGTTTTTAKGTGVTIAVLDTGFTPGIDSLNELSGRVNPPMNALAPFDAVNTFKAANTLDFWEGHGTQVAILAAGNGHGVAVQSRVLPIKVCAEGEGGRASCNTRDVLRGLCFALNQVPAKNLVINLSLGGSTPTNAIHAVLNYAQAQGAVVVAAGGNQGEQGSPKEYPAAFAQGIGTQVSLPLLAVASVRPVTRTNWAYSAFSTRGTYLNISAPGEWLDIGHPYLYSGTSFAAPLVAGAAALVKSVNASTPPNVIKAFMLMPTHTSIFPGIQPMLKLQGY